jgi:hypothetical protein
MKKCVKCNIEKKLKDYGKDKSTPDGLRYSCIICTKEYQKNYNAQYRLKNKEKITEKAKKYYIKNSDKLKLKIKEYNYNNIEKRKDYLEKTKEIRNKKTNEYIKNKKKINPLFKLSCNIRNLIGISIKNNGYTKKSKTNKYLGCSFEEFKIYLEKQFTEGMTWESQGKWHLDHIYPVSLAKNEDELIKLNHYTNFQPLWAIDNIKKSNKI